MFEMFGDVGVGGEGQWKTMIDELRVQTKKLYHLHLADRYWLKKKRKGLKFTMYRKGSGQSIELYLICFCKVPYLNPS